MREGEIEKRSELRNILDQYYSVEFSISSWEPVYLFKIRDVSSLGTGILVKENSAVLKHLNVGDVLDMKYNPAKSPDLPECVRTEIKHITKFDHGPYRGYYLVGLLLLRGSED